MSKYHVVPFEEKSDYWPVEDCIYEGNDKIVADVYEPGLAARVAACLNNTDIWADEVNSLRVFVAVFDRYQCGEATNAELEAARAAVDA